MRRKASRLLLSLACAALFSSACATESRTGPRLEPHAGIASLWLDFLDLRPARALALAGDPDLLWVGAAAGGHASQIEAEQEALDGCRRRRAARRMQAPCRLYATGDEIVWELR